MCVQVCVCQCVCVSEPYLLPAQVRGDAVQVQVVAQLLHLQLHQLRPLQQVAVEALAGVAEAGAGLQVGGAAAAVVLLAVHAHMLRRRGGGENVTQTHLHTNAGDGVRVTFLAGVSRRPLQVLQVSSGGGGGEGCVLKAELV